MTDGLNVLDSSLKALHGTLAGGLADDPEGNRATARVLTALLTRCRWRFSIDVLSDPPFPLVEMCTQTVHHCVQLDTETLLRYLKIVTPTVETLRPLHRISYLRRK